jgi:hypothetical protein
MVRTLPPYRPSKRIHRGFCAFGYICPRKYRLSVLLSGYQRIFRSASPYLVATV